MGIFTWKQFIDDILIFPADEILFFEYIYSLSRLRWTTFSKIRFFFLSSIFLTSKCDIKKFSMAQLPGMGKPEMYLLSEIQNPQTIHREKVSQICICTPFSVLKCTYFITSHAHTQWPNHFSFSMLWYPLNSKLISSVDEYKLQNYFETNLPLCTPERYANEAQRTVTTYMPHANVYSRAAEKWKANIQIFHGDRRNGDACNVLSTI